MQTQGSKLSEQIKSTSVALGKYPASSAQPVSKCKSNVVVYGVDEILQRPQDMETMIQIFNSINVRVDPTHILDCFQLGKFKSQQTRPRPILVKLQRSIDANTILANESSLSSPLFIKPDMIASECAIESALLKQRWLQTEAGYDSKQIKFSNKCIYVSGKRFGQVTNGEFHCSENYQIHPPQPLQHKDTASAQPTSMDQQQSSDVIQPTTDCNGC